MQTIMIGMEVISTSFYNEIGQLKYHEAPMRGIFQRWGDILTYEDEKHFSLTVAIILGDDGKVYSAPPHAVSLVK